MAAGVNFASAGGCSFVQLPASVAK